MSTFLKEMRKRSLKRRELLAQQVWKSILTHQCHHVYDTVDTIPVSFVNFTGKLVTCQFKKNTIPEHCALVRLELGLLEIHKCL